MGKYIGFILGAIAVILIVVFRKQIGAFFSPSNEGTACTVNNNPGTIKNGVCVQNPPAEGSACMIGGRPGTIVNGACVVNENAQRIIVPPTIRLPKSGMMCSPRITIRQYPGFGWILTGSDKFYCYYRRA